MMPAMDRRHGGLDLDHLGAEIREDGCRGRTGDQLAKSITRKPENIP